MPERILGDRIVLVQHRIELSIAAAEAIEESLDELRPWQPWVAKFDGVRSCEQYANWVGPQWGRRFDYQILRRDDDRFLGQICLEEYRPDVPSIMVGYWLRTSATGYGYATEAAGILMRLAFDDLKVARFVLLCDARNGRSAAVARRLGLDLEGVLRNERRDALGGLQDTMVWSRVRTEATPASS